MGTRPELRTCFFYLPWGMPATWGSSFRIVEQRDREVEFIPPTESDQ